MPYIIVLIALFSGSVSIAGSRICQNQDSALLLRDHDGKLILEDFVGSPALSAALAGAGLALPLELSPNATVVTGPGGQTLRTDWILTTVRLRFGVGVGPMKFDFTYNCPGDESDKKPRSRPTKPRSSDPLGGIGPITPL